MVPVLEKVEHVEVRAFKLLFQGCEHVVQMVVGAAHANVGVHLRKGVAIVRVSRRTVRSPRCAASWRAKAPRPTTYARCSHACS